MARKALPKNKVGWSVYVCMRENCKLCTDALLCETPLQTGKYVDFWSFGFL